MGLELVELIMDVEEEFDIRVVDDEYSELRTVGSLYQLILKKIDQHRDLLTKPEVCPCIPAFLSTRRALQSLIGVQRHLVKPTLKLAEIIPGKNQRKLWADFEQYTNIQIHSYRFNEQTTFLFPFVLLSLLPFAVVVGHSFGVVGMVMLVSTLLMLFKILYRYSIPYPMAHPHQFQTVADLVRCAKPPHYPLKIRTNITYDKHVIWDKLLTIVSETLNVPKQDLKPETRFIEDLNAG